MKKFLRFDCVLLIFLAVFCLSCAAFFFYQRSAGGHYTVMTQSGGAARPQESASTPPELSVALPIDLNSATKEELMELPGIGETRAEAVLAYREANGAFTGVDELTAVDGIGEKTLEKLRGYVTVK
ncbi:MAG: helix-hairpin-helix domain-containing protein [Oscillospiraceae bacterium]|nr:helix-hairpin-helix domain-containing protein [Oscillospiraceae bacterium]